MMNRRQFLQLGAASAIPTEAFASNSQVIANIGDHGNGGTQRFDAVFRMVNSWNPDCVFTNGDCSYSYDYGRDNDAYKIRFGGDFLPCVGNHDRDDEARNGASYFEYFQVPAYYFRDYDDIRLISLDSTRNWSGQMAWAKNALESSPKRWNVVFFHYPPYTSGSKPDYRATRLLKHEWGADLIISGHDHIWERLNRPEGMYIVNGLGGDRVYRFKYNDEPYSVSKYSGNSGALKLTVSRTKLTGEFHSISDGLIDSFELSKSINMAPIINFLISGS